MSGWRPGTRVGDYVLGDRLGAGGMGDVFRATHAPTGAARALKALPPDADPEALLRFQREAEAQARVDSHPNVVTIHSFGQEAGRHYLVMDLAAGGDLETRLKREGPLDPAEAVRLVGLLASGLAHAHAHGILHRDLKPANVVFDERGIPRLVDFGLARMADRASLTQSGTITGTPAYMAPEQARGERADERTDVYGLGATLYACLTGQPPFTSRGLKLLDDVGNAAPRPPSELRPGVPRALDSLCMRALAKSPARRPESAQAVAQILRDCASQEGARPARLPLVAAGALGAVLVLALVAWLSSPVRVDPPPPDPPPAADLPPAVPDRPTLLNPAWARPDFEGQLPPIATPEVAAPPPDEVYVSFGPRGQEALATARQGNPRDMVKVADQVRRFHSMKEPEAILHWTLRARSAGDARSGRLLGVSQEGAYKAAIILRRHPQAHDSERAALLFSELAHAGDPRGMFELAEMLFEGEHPFSTDAGLAAEWLELAIGRLQADGRPFFLLGWLHLRGAGVEQDLERAEALFRESTTKLNGERGWIGLAESLRGREGPKEAARFLEATYRERGLDHPLIYAALGDLFYEVGDYERFAAYVKRGQRSEPLWFRHEVFIRLQEAYEKGLGVERSPRAENYLELAIAAGSPEGLLRSGDPKSVSRAAELGHPAAMREWARLLRVGVEGRPPDPILANHWLERARLRKTVGDER